MIYVISKSRVNRRVWEWQGIEFCDFYYLKIFNNWSIIALQCSVSDVQ